MLGLWIGYWEGKKIKIVVDQHREQFGLHQLTSLLRSLSKTAAINGDCTSRILIEPTHCSFDRLQQAVDDVV